MRLLRLLALGAALLLGLPASASAAGFGATTPLTESQPFASQPVHAYVFDNNKLQVTRTFPDGRPASTVDVPTPVGNVDTNLHVASNPRGDALVTWTENGGGNHLAVALFWPTGAQTPNDAHELLSTDATASAPWAVLDPGGSATVIWYDALIRQVRTADAGRGRPLGRADGRSRRRRRHRRGPARRPRGLRHHRGGSGHQPDAGPHAVLEGEGDHAHGGPSLPAHGGARRRLGRSTGDAPDALPDGAPPGGRDLPRGPCARLLHHDPQRRRRRLRHLRARGPRGARRRDRRDDAAHVQLAARLRSRPGPV